MMKLISTVLAMIILLFCSMPVNAAKKHHHVYNSGIVSYFGNKQITIENGTYTLRPEVTVVLLVKDASGAYYKQPGRLSDISTGKLVHLKSRGKMVYEIEVEMQ